MRCWAPILRWKPHLGQTLRLASSSALKSGARQPGHLIQRPSVRTRWGSPSSEMGAKSVPKFWPESSSGSGLASARLNQDILDDCKAYGVGGAVKGNRGLGSVCGKSILDV